MNSKNISKEKILEAAANVFAREGLDKASIDEIAKEAKVAKGSVYNYFKSKDELYSEGAKYSINKRISSLQEVLIRFPSAEGKLKALINANKQMADKFPEMFLMNYALMISTHKDIRVKSACQAFKLYIDFVEEIIKLGIKQGEFINVEARNIAFILIVSQDFDHILNAKEKPTLNRNEPGDEIFKLIVKKVNN